MARKPRTNDLSFSKGPIRPGDWPADKVERWPVSKLRAYPQNPMMHSDAQVEQIMASMREFGWTIPVLVDEKGEIIAGHGRLMAATKLGLAEVPVMVAKGWTEAQRRAYRISDNQLPRLGEWSPEMLKLELSDLKLAEYPLELLGFEDVQLVTFMAGVGTSGDEERTPEPPSIPTTVKGDIWLLGGHRLLCGDSTSGDDVQRLFAEDAPHLMVTDPPYGVNYNPKWRDDLGLDWTGRAQRRSTHPDIKPLKTRSLGKVSNDDRADWSDTWRLFTGDVVYVWHGGLHAGDVMDSIEDSGFLIRSQIIWAKQHFVFGRGDYHWQHEPCWYAVRKGASGRWYGDRSQSTVWNIANASAFHGEKDDTSTDHGTQKPIECMKRPIENNSAPGDYVYDPFVGSGTTIIAAEMTGRCCLAIEIEPTYVDVAIIRWQDYTNKKATLEATGQTFEEVAEERRKKRSPPKRAPSRRKNGEAISEAPQSTA